MGFANLRTTLSTQAGGRGKYPFTDTCTLTSTQGLEIPASLFTDASVYPAGGRARQFISRIAITMGVMAIVLSDETGPIAWGHAQLGVDTQVLFKDQYDRPAGILLGGDEHGNLGPIANVLPEGVYDFDIAATELVATCVIPQPQAVLEGLQLADNAYLSGDIWLVGKDGVVLEPVEGQNLVKIHIVGDPFFNLRQCDPDKPTVPPRPIKQIRIVMDDQLDEDDQPKSVLLVPDEFGHTFVTTGSNQASDNVLRVESITNGLRISAIGTSANQRSVT